MAIDTAAKRLAVMNLAVPVLLIPLPVPDGSGVLSLSDRFHLLNLFPEDVELNDQFTVHGLIQEPKITGYTPVFQLSGLV